MDKEAILDAIRSEALLNGGKPLGKERFVTRTGIKNRYWEGTYWTKWSDALEDAGFAPNEFQAAHDKNSKLKSFLNLARRLNRVPTTPEMRMEKRNDPSFPNANGLLAELGGRSGLLREARNFCKITKEFENCLALLGDEQEESLTEEPASAKSARRGYVYLIRSGRYYKIGITEALYRRAAQIANGTPEGAEILHSFMTDDPKGIEAYWHRRFADKRVQGMNIASGEWFLLDAADVAAFKLRKNFM